MMSAASDDGTTHLENLTAKEIFSDWKQSATGLSDIYYVVNRIFIDDDFEEHA